MTSTSDRVPPGQKLSTSWPVLHYGRIPEADLDTWDLHIFGAVAGGEVRISHTELLDLPNSTVTADFHCVTKISVLDNTWEGVRGDTIMEAYPPTDDCTHVMVWAEFGYSANVSREDFATGMAVVGRNGQQLTAEHGWPLRMVFPDLYAWKSVKWVRAIQYLQGNERGFWEQRGYHNRGNVWKEERYAYQEDDTTRQ